jgi:signal transduction histidine kinase
MTSRGTGSVQECLFGGLLAVREGRDPLLAGLTAARLGLGASRGIWVSNRPGRGAISLSEPGCELRREDLPACLPTRWLEQAPTGRARLLGPNWLRRDPRAVAAGLDWALVAQAERTQGRLWFESSSPLQVDSAWIGDLLAALEHLEELANQGDQKRQRDRLELMGEHAAGVAHDLRNQLSLVQLEYSRHADEGLLSEELEHGLEGALELCRNFLSVRKHKARPPYPLKPLLVKEIRAASSLSLREGEVRVALRCLPGVEANNDQALLRRILRNLLLNGIAATPSGSSVELEACKGATGVEILIRDEGRGMSRSELDRLLRAGESRGGTGFGTSSVLACVEQLGADLEVESAPAAGTEFLLRLPSEALPKSGETPAVS